jgi:hypothetical protein
MELVSFLIQVLLFIMMISGVNIKIRPIIGFSSTKVYCDYKERFAGESKYPFKKMLAVALMGLLPSVPLLFDLLLSLDFYL